MAPSVLARSKQLTEPTLRSLIGTFDDHISIPASYHFGWSDSNGAPTNSDSGKSIRAALAVLGAEAVGGDAELAIPGAAAVELIHNFSLVHDDIMDNDTVRRHRPAVWDHFGVGDAILAGDAMHTLAFQVLLANQSSPHTLAAVTRLATATTAMLAGQAQDISLDRGNSATVQQCLAMEADKTGALLAQSVAIGAVLGGGDDDQINALERYGTEMGLAFQAVDDVLGIWGDPALTGKAAGNDLRETKKSMPIALAFERGGEIEAAVRHAYANEMTEAGIAELTNALADAGIRGEVEAIADHHLNQAVVALDHPTLAEQPRSELIELANYVAIRTT